MKNKIIAGNWKMNQLPSGVKPFVEELKTKLPAGMNGCSVVLCVPATHLAALAREKARRIGVGAQNVSEFDKGAHTGEISVDMIADLGAKYCIVGHSERRSYHGETVTDRYGRKIPKHTHGTANLPRKTSSARSITDAVLGVYDAKVNPKLSIRRLTITANRLVGEDTAQQEPEAPVQFNLFDNVEVQEQRLQEEEAKLKRERKIQEAMLDIKKKFGKNAILNGGSYLEGATAKERNKQIGGHKA